MKKHNQHQSAERKKQLEAMRELRGNAIMLLEPVTKTAKEVILQQQMAQYSTYEYQGQTQRLEQYDTLQSETSFMLRDAKEQQHAYVNAHGGGLIPPANFSDNPFTSYMKSIQSTVGQVQKLSVKITQPADALQIQKSILSDQTLAISQSDNSRNQKASRSVQPQQFLDQSSETAINRIQVKQKLSRNVTNERSSFHRSSQFDKMTSNLQDNEIQALRVANPQHHAFNTHLSKVISSVQHRRRTQDSIDQPVYVTSSTQEIVPYYEGESAQTIIATNTPKRVREEARRELALLKEDGLKQQGKHYTMFKPQIKDSFVPQQRAVDQIFSLLSRVNKNKEQVFIPLEVVNEKSIGGVAFKDAANQLEVHNGQIVFTKAGLVSIAADKHHATEVISKETYIQEGVQQMILNQVPFFRKFQAMKTFKLWKSTMQRNVFNRNRLKLSQNFLFSKPIFASKFMPLITCANEIRTLKLIDSKPETFYGKHQTNQFDTQCAIQVQQSKETIQLNLTVIIKILETMKKEIILDDKEFLEYCKESEVQRIINERVDKQELVLMSKTRALKDNEHKQKALMHLRHAQYNALLQVVCRMLFTNIVQLLIENKKEFAAMFCSKQQAQFEISLSLSSQGILTTSPTFQEHRQLFQKMFIQMEDAIFKNTFLAQFLQDIVQLYFWEDKKTNPPGAALIRRQIVEIEEEVCSRPQYLADGDQVTAQIQVDLGGLEKQMLNYSQVEEVWAFTHDWSEKRQKIAQNKTIASAGNSISDEIEFYKLTWVKLGQLDAIIERIPDTNTKIGTVLLETASLKKSLADMPRQIVQSIRTNVTQTIENETKALLQELSTASDTLHKTPSSLNVYVDQVNTLRYLQEKQDDFKNKYNTIISLQKQCKQDNIKISTKLQLSIEEVTQLYDNQPKLNLQAQQGLKQNKLSVEQSMLRSSESLALKIKAFEKKYVETYLQDRTRLERAKETLDEIFRRSQAILEMKSKVVLYKEFLKILYQDDQDAESKIERKKLSCAEACDFMEDIHKNTIKMWKLFVYWITKRHLCFTTPFLEFDLKVITKAISKVTKFLADQAQQSEVVAFKSQPITRAVNSQVKDTQIIIEFVKDMNKDTLKERHWHQIFTLLKASHLKNSSVFTIVDLRECNIQNQAKEVRAIIEHANTEAKYESVFANINKEWEESKLQIIPFKDQINDYVLANSELMSEAIEENLSTLDTLARSPYAAHVTKDIQELIVKLKTMLAHLMLWSQAQKYWVTLDPIYNSGLLDNFFGESTNQFLDARQSFRRVMWSSYRRPKTTYCLMISDRLPVFEMLINFYSMVQKQVNGFLETKRLQFSRFYFLNDAQFLNMMMLVNSSQDFNIYINMLFQGASKLFVTKLLHSVPNHQQSDSDDDLELQLEQFIQNGRQFQSQNVIREEDSDIQNKDFNFRALDNILGLPVLHGLQRQEQPLPKRNFEDGGIDAQSLVSSDESDSSIQDPVKEIARTPKVNKLETQDFVILGFVSGDKELLLFDKHVSMTQPMEKWLSETELAMQDSLRRQMIDSIEHFTSEPLEEWVLDYPQQTVIATLHLILSQEIQDILTGNNYPQAKAYEETAMQIGKTEITIEEGILKRRQDTKALDALRNQVVIRQRSTFEPIQENEELQLQFLDECFGEQTKYDEPLERAVQAMKKDQAAYLAMNVKKSQYSIRKPDFKEQVLQVLQHKGLNSLYMRLQFWINKMIKLMYTPVIQVSETQQRVVEMPGLSRQRIKSVVLFLKHQQELVEALVKLEVVNVNDFEWQSKLRLTWTPECEAQAVCGGWSLNLGYEYLGTSQRLVLTPLTPRYFVFMASALREKQSAILSCAKHDTTANEIVREFANLCAIPFKSQECTAATNLSTFTQLLNGGAMANTWVFFEHLDCLPLEKLKIVVKEIQLLHEQFIVSGFSRNLLKQRYAKQQGLNISSESQLFPPNTQLTTLGIFASASVSLQSSAQRKMFEDICRASFRIISLAKPNLKHLVENLLQVENFTEYRSQSNLFVQAVNKFIEGREDQENCLEVSDLRQCFKIATLRSNREFQTYYKQTLKQKRQEESLAQCERREVYVVQNKETQHWETKKKLRDQWISERQQLAMLINRINNQKFKIEMDALKHSLIDLIVRKFQVNDPRQNAEKKIEGEIQSAIQVVIADKQNHDILRENKRQHKMVASDPVEETKEVVQLIPIEILSNARSFRNMRREDSLSDYQAGQMFAPSKSTDFITQLEQSLQSVGQSNNYLLTSEQLSNCIQLVQGMRRHRGIIISGPSCSGKTTVLQLVTLALKQMASITLRTSYICPATFTQSDLFGQTLAYDQNSVMQLEQPLQAKSIFELILQNYALEKRVMTQKNKLIQSLYIDSAEIDQSLADCFVQFMKTTNLRERDYLSDNEFLIDIDGKQLQQRVLDVGVKFQNGNVVQMPSDIYLFFESRSLKHASPSFIAQTCIVNLKASDVQFTDIFNHQLKKLEQTHKVKLDGHHCNFDHVANCCSEFVQPFIKAIDQKSEIPKWPLWQIKQLTIQFFHFLNASLYQLIESADHQKTIQDDSFQLQEMERDVLWNIVLSSTVWSYGAVLNKELRLVFDQMFSPFKSKFTITFAVQSKQKLKLFDFFYDIPKLQFAIFIEKLEYKLKSYYEPALQALLLPTVDISQAFFMLDCQVSYMRRDKDLNKSFRMMGPSSSSKTVILNTFASKLQVSTITISVPMTAYMTLDLFKERAEENYRKKRENSLVPKDPTKQILLVIDDAHLQFNLNVQLLEFIRSWSFARGYYSVDKGQFKQIADFSCILSQNSNFRPTTKQSDRFLESATTLFCNEIGMDSYKTFIQSWLTSNSWSVSQMLSKFYLLISSSLLVMLDKMSNAEGLNNFTFSPITSFHFVAKFCANLVINSSFTDSKADVFGLGTASKDRPEEEAVADLFCYEFMRTFGDRLLRPASQLFLMEKLSDVCQHEFLCREHYTVSYIEQLVLGNYHNKDELATHKYLSIMSPEIKEEAEGLIRQKVKRLSGNQFLLQLLDAPKGLADCFKVSRVLYKAQQHLILVGQSGSSKLEMVQLAAITNNAPMFEIDAPAYGEPLKFAYNLRQILLSVCKINKPSYIVLNDQAVRDPVYYDYVYNFLSQLSRHESFVMFDDQFFVDLAAIEAQHIKKQAKVALPDEYTLFKQAVQKLQKNVHFVFVVSDLMTYKEIVSMFPQLEYICEVIYLEDLTQKDYFEMCCEFTKRSGVQPEVIGEDNQFAHSMVEIKNRVKQLLLKTYYSKQMLKYTMREEFQVHGAQEYVFSDSDTLTRNIYKDSKSYNVFDENMQQTLLNMPIGVASVNKHRFGVFIEVSKFIYDLLSMHLSSRKSYYETFQAKSKQFVKYFKSVKESKNGLQEDQSNHNFRVAMAQDKIQEIQQSLLEKQINIKKKSLEIQELQEELNLAEAEVETVIEEKNSKLAKLVQDLKSLNPSHFAHIITMANGLTDAELDLLTIVNVTIQQQDLRQTRSEAVEIFKTKADMVDLLDNRRQLMLPRLVFERFHEFIQQRSIVEYNSKPLLVLLYEYIQELYRKLNIKNTMQTIFNRIKEIRSQIDANTFSINYAKQSNESKQAELKSLGVRLEQLYQSGGKLSRKIEEAELSYMRTDQIFTSVQEYAAKIDLKLQSVTSRTQTLVGDSILLGSSVVFFGVFAPEERENLRATLIEYLTKVRNMKFNKIWTEVSSNQTANPTKSMFQFVLKDLGLRELVCKHNLPPVLSNHQFCEALFTMLFAPSCPVICDPTGVVQEFTERKLFANMDPAVVSGADLQANDKLSFNLAANKPSIVVDVSSHNSYQSGLSYPHSLLRCLSNTLYNGIDFDAHRLGMVTKIGAMGSFLTHQTGQNKRISIVSAPFEHISLYQAQVFQPRFDFQLTQDFLQNATFINASPSLAIESRLKLEENGAIIKLKEIITERLVPECYDFGRSKAAIAELNVKIEQLERNYENAFLIASSDTFKKIGEYSGLRTAVEDIIEAREQKAEYILKYRAALRQIKLVTEASDVIYQIYMVLKLTGKQTNQITYSWARFIILVDQLLAKLLDTVKQDKLGLIRAEDDGQDIEVEIDNNFFKKRLVPLIHQTVAASLEVSSVPLFNLFLALRLAHTYKAITPQEHQYIVKQLTELKGYKQWRDPDHQFVKIQDVADKQMHVSLRRELLRIYPDLARQVFDQIEKTLGPSFKYIDASIFISKELKDKYKFTQVQQLTFGFLCPDMEFKSKLTLFMYTQNMATFEFSEEVASLGDFLQAADLQDPVLLKTAPHLNPINLVTTLAQSNGRSLVVLRTDPTEQTMKFATQLFNQQLSAQISSQLKDFSTVRFQAANTVNSDDKHKQSNLNLSQREVLAKQLWMTVKQRDVNLDEGKIFFSESENTVGKDHHPHTHHILQAARAGEWVLLCPVQFPHYFQKLTEKLCSMRANNQMDPRFRLIIDLQNYNQCEVPDSFTFADSFTFQLNESNQDRVTTLSDIWSKILNPQLLERLTDDQGNENLKKLEYSTAGLSLGRPTQFMQVFSKEAKDQHALHLFNKFIEKSSKDFKSKLKAQRVKQESEMQQKASETSMPVQIAELVKDIDETEPRLDSSEQKQGEE